LFTLISYCAIVFSFALMFANGWFTACDGLYDASTCWLSHMQHKTITITYCYATWQVDRDARSFRRIIVCWKLLLDTYLKTSALSMPGRNLLFYVTAEVQLFLYATVQSNP